MLSLSHTDGVRLGLQVHSNGPKGQKQMSGGGHWTIKGYHVLISAGRRVTKQILYQQRGSSGSQANAGDFTTAGALERPQGSEGAVRGG